MKNKIYKAMVAVFAMAVVAASPATSLTTHAIGFDIDAPEGTVDYGTDSLPDDYWNDSSNWVEPDSSDGDSGSNESSEPEPAPAPSEDNNSYEEPSYNEPSYNEPSSNSSSSAGSYDNSSVNSSASANSNVSAPSSNHGTAKKANDVTVSVTGGQKFRIVTGADHTTYQVYHCGISRASFTAADADGNAVAFSNVTLEKGEDGLWYLNVKFAEGIDTKDFTVTVTKGDAAYLSTTLGVSGIKINGTAALSTIPATDTE